MATETAPRPVEFDDAGLDVWSDEERFEVTRERIAEYAAATNDPIPAHLSGEIASPVFAIVPVFEAMMMPVIDVVPMDIFGRVVHGEQDFHFHRPIRPGDRLVSRAKAVGYEGRENGTTITILIECRDSEGELVNEQYLTAFFRNIDVGKRVGESAPAHKFDPELEAQPPLARVAAHVDDDQTYRYAPASGDPVPLHLDEQVAKDAGLPGIIAHGLCTMAMSSWAVLTEVAGSDVHRLKRFAVRFSKMVFPGDDLETQIWKVGSTGSDTTYAFRTARGTDLVLTDGLAVVADNS
ncbi:MaoC/PaaZ C-terminal domain-containing protein [Nocardia nova]|uniref:MaoC/PaaZ C-terminal domain-containing protein n=1 Tax=Nocardia nova TaxID=37330 RepID=UPI00189345E4|nr:MaoC/PaaZ C-terminal domain-containing protein [Nocardia nova]MBF6145004.1 MaoC family dehydratase N-terminal domain-containing protein [Nocardia nova]MDN2496839.1 dehydratase [Nocardia nova]